MMKHDQLLNILFKRAYEVTIDKDKKSITWYFSNTTFSKIEWNFIKSKLDLESWELDSVCTDIHFTNDPNKKARPEYCTYDGSLTYTPDYTSYWHTVRDLFYKYKDCRNPTTSNTLKEAPPREGGWAQFDRESLEQLEALGETPSQTYYGCASHEVKLLDGTCVKIIGVPNIDFREIITFEEKEMIKMTEKLLVEINGDTYTFNTYEKNSHKQVENVLMICMNEIKNIQDKMYELKNTATEAGIYEIPFNLREPMETKVEEIKAIISKVSALTIE